MVQQIYGKELRQTDIFALDRGDGKGQERWEALSKRVTEHVFLPCLEPNPEYPCRRKIFHQNSYGSIEHLS